MKFVIDAGAMGYKEFQEALGADGNFGLVDTLLNAMDYGEVSGDGKIHDKNNVIKITFEA